MKKIRNPDLINAPMAECHLLFVHIMETMRKHHLQLELRQDVQFEKDEPTIVTDISLRSPGSRETVRLLRNRMNREEDSLMIEAHFASTNYFCLGAATNYLWHPEAQRLTMPLSKLIADCPRLIACIEGQGYDPL